jgi:hypothetical protein
MTEGLGALLQKKGKWTYIPRGKSGDKRLEIGYL